MGTLLDSVELFVLLQLVQCLSLLFNHVTVCEWEEIKTLDLLHLVLVVLSLALLVKQDLIGSDKSICLVRLILKLILALFVHLLTLVLKQVLLVFAALDFVKELFVALLMDLIDNLSKKVIVVRSVKNNALCKTSTSLTVAEALHKWIRNRLSITNCQSLRLASLTCLW